MRTSNSDTFGKWRLRFWPIHAYELKKFIPLLFIKFFVSLNYGILACTKDTLIVTSKGSGAEVIPVLKGWIVLPCAILATLIYSKLSNRYSRRAMFYGTISTFLVLIGLYAFVLYPLGDAILPHKSADYLTTVIGQKHQHWIALYRNWIHAIFFVVAELWGSMIILLTFWGFANQISSVGEAKRSYTLFNAAGDLAAFATGPLIWYFCNKHIENYSFTLQGLLSCVLFFGLLTLVFYWWMDRYVLTDKRFYDPDGVDKASRQKTKLSLAKSIKYIFKSKYLLCLAIMVIGYGLAISMIEVSWKATLKLEYPNPSEFQAYMGTITTFVGLVSFLIALFIGGGFIRLFGWNFSAQIPPLMVGFTGLVFFFLLIFQNALSPALAMIGITPLFLLVSFGAFQNVMSKAVKYSFFDPTKEMAFIPLDQEAKVKGKAAIDVIGSRLGKSGSAWIQVGLIDLVGTGSVLSISPYLVPIVLITVIFWSMAVRSVGKEFSPDEQPSQIPTG